MAQSEKNKFGSNMSLSKALEEYIRKLYGELGTQQAVAGYLGITQSYVQQILSGRTQTKNMKIEVFDKMFPNLQIELGSQKINLNGNNSPNVIQAAGGSSVVVNAPGALVTYRMRLLDAVIELDIETGAKDTVLRAIRAVPME